MSFEDWNPFNKDTFARRERRALADLLLAKGPAAPTLCEGWDARDLAVHLVVREHRPDAAAGMFIGPLEGRLEQVSEEYSRRPFEGLVETFRGGPPKWSPMLLADPLANGAENFIHHEDLRRGGGEITPREFSQEDQELLWTLVKNSTSMFLRDSATQVTLTWREPGASLARESVTGAKNSDPQMRAEITGEPGELLLWLFGRGKSADLTEEFASERAKEGLKLSAV